MLIRSLVGAVTGTQVRWRKLRRQGTATVTGQHRPAPGQAAVPAGRDRWFDVLRSLALVRVMAYHMFGAVWLSVVFPAMGVMFALAGSLMARSVDRSSRRAVTGRLRRLLPALWVLAVVLLPVMLWRGWPDRPAWPALLTWVVPVAQPPGADWALPATEVLWYLVTYLWLVLLSPALLWLYRRWPVPTLLLPLAVLVVRPVLAPVSDSAVDSVITDIATFGACWILGFAHRGGGLRRLPIPLLVAAAALTMGGGLGWAFTHAGENGLDLNDIPLAQAFYSFGFVLLLLRAAPSMTWLARVRPLDRIVTSLNNRAVTIYLWHNLAIAASFVVGDALGVFRLGQVAYFGVALMIVLAVILTLGWVEDVAAGRKARLLPWRGQTSTPAARPVPAAKGRGSVGAGPVGTRP